MTASLTGLLESMAAREQLQNPDLVVPAAALQMTDMGTIKAPSGASYAMTPWSRNQLSTVLGLRWDRWFSGASSAQRAEEVNRRLQRCSPHEQVKLRTTGEVPEDTDANGTLTAIVSPSYSPISDVVVGRILEAGLRGTNGAHKILRQLTTDKTSSYVVGVGEPQKIGGVVGAVWGGLHIMNSGVGFCCLSITAFLVRLVCSNGMRAPVMDAEIVRRRHRGVRLEVLGEHIFEGIRQLPQGLRRSMDVLDASTRHAVGDVEATVREILHGARIPIRKHTEGIMSSFAAEPMPSAFGISQAITDYAKGTEPEMGIELERAAGNYLITVASA